MKKINNRSERKIVRRKRRNDGGKMIRVDPHPPDFCSAPWFNLTVRVENVPANFTTIQLQAAISTQLNVVFADSIIDVRLQSVRVWGALPNDNTRLAPINVFVIDPIGITTPSATGNAGTGTRILEQITDYPDRVSRACLGYVYPKAQREVAIRCSNQGPNQILVSNGLGAGSVAYFRIQWRPTGSVPPTFENAMQQMSIDSDSEVEILSVKGTKKKLVK